MDGNVRHVFLITDGPSCGMVDDVSSPEIESSAEAVLRSLQRCHQTGNSVEFRVTSGLICTTVRDEDGWLEIEPLLLRSLPLVVKLDELWVDPEDPQAVNMLARVHELMEYHTLLPDEHHDIPVLEVGDLVRISYHLLQNVGGLDKVASTAIGRVTLPVVNAHSQLCRQYVTARQSNRSHQRGRGIYKVRTVATGSLPSENTPERK